VEHAAHLDELRDRRGLSITLALEPEPCCLLETTEETVAFFQTHLFAPAAEAQLARRRGITRARAAEVLRRHIGVCYDACHAAVEFEEPRTSIERLRSAGIAIAELLLVAALRVPSVSEEPRPLLQPYGEPVYLHHVAERSDGQLKRYLDLPDALHDTPPP